MIYHHSVHSFIGNELFDSFSEYIITKPQACDKLLTFEGEQHVNNSNGGNDDDDDGADPENGNVVSRRRRRLLFMGVPQLITDRRYRRNALLFNIVFVFDITDTWMSAMARVSLRQAGGNVERAMQLLNTVGGLHTMHHQYHGRVASSSTYAFDALLSRQSQPRRRQYPISIMAPEQRNRAVSSTSADSYIINSGDDPSNPSGLDNDFAMGTKSGNYSYNYDDDDDDDDDDELFPIGAFKPIARKLSFLFRSFEIESHFLSKESSRDRLRDILKRMLHDLNTYRVTSIPIGTYACGASISPQFSFIALPYARSNAQTPPIRLTLESSPFFEIHLQLASITYRYPSAIYGD